MARHDMWPRQTRWVSPTAGDAKGRGYHYAGKDKDKGIKCLSLVGQVRQWQTPVADDAVDREAGKVNSRGEPKLSAQVKLWPTPVSTDGSNGGLVTPRKGREGGNLVEAVSARTLWPTPTCQDAKNNGAASQMERNTKPLNAEVGGSLNPDWVELLMGWPRGWTALDKAADAPDADWAQIPGRWHDGTWEDGVPRVATGVAARVHRLRCIGNGQVPFAAAMAWSVLAGHFRIQTHATAKEPLTIRRES